MARIGECTTSVPIAGACDRVAATVLLQLQCIVEGEQIATRRVVTCRLSHLRRLGVCAPSCGVIQFWNIIRDEDMCISGWIGGGGGGGAETQAPARMRKMSYCAIVIRDRTCE